MSHDRPLDTTFRSAIRRLDAAGRLVKVNRQADPRDEVAAIMRALDGDRAVLFEDVIGHEIPVVGNVLASPANCEVAFGVDVAGLRGLARRALHGRLAPVVVQDPAAQQVVHTDNIDLTRLLPVLRHTPSDGGSFITAGIVIVTDPETGVHNASYHRLQVIGPDQTCIKMDAGRHLRTIFERARSSGQSLPISVCIGTDLAVMYAAACMGSRMPFDADELEAAGALRGGPLHVARGVSQDVTVIAESEFVLEGVISLEQTAHEGPFAEFVGYLSDEGPAPVMQVTALTHRTDPLYHAISGAGRETVMLRKYVLEASVLDALQAAVPIVEDVEMTAGGLHRFHIVISVRKTIPQHEGWQRNAILAAFSALKDLDQAVVVDSDIDIRDPAEVEYAIATRMEASRDVLVLPGLRGHEYVRVSDHGIRAKLGIDATVPLADADRFRRAAFADVVIADEDLSRAPASSALRWIHRVHD